METSELVKLAEAIVDPLGSPDKIVERLEEYAVAFDRWFESNRAALEGTATPEQRAQFGELGLRHVAVMDLALTLKDQAGLDLKNLRARGKGIMAYTDSLPKSVSIHTKRKG